MNIKKGLIFVFIMLFISLVGCNLSSKTIKEDYGLSSIKDGDELKKLFKSNYKRNFFSSGIMQEDSADLKEGAQQTNGSTTDYTKTNVQVEGVDEGDKIKTDGKRIYSLSNSNLRVVEALPDGSMNIVLSENLIADEQASRVRYYYTYYDSLYLTDKYLVVIGQIYQNHYFDLYTNQEPISYYRPIHLSVAFIYDLDTLTLVDKYEISGHLNTSRLIDNKLYLISTYSPYYSSEKDNEMDLRPWVKEQDQLIYFDYEDIKYLPNMQYESFTLITTITLGDEVKYENDVFLAYNYWSVIYVSKNAIYLTAYQYDYNIFGTTKRNSKVVSYQFSDEGLVYGGMATFLGVLNNQFFIDEYDGYLRLASTEGWSGENVKNRLYVFKRQLKDGIYTLEQVGLLDRGLGKVGETIKSVRFNKDKATIVTFQQTDPFYTIDLSDPTNPKIIGALEIPGFSTYQHPWRENLVVGIGFNAIDGRQTGMKLALYDISDFNNPIEVGKPLIISNNVNSWSYSEALFNHKAIFIDQKYNSLGFGLYRSNWTNGYYTATNDYLVFDVDETRDEPIQIKATFNHIDYFTENVNDYKEAYWNYNFNIERAVRIDGHLYLVSGEVITSHNIDNEYQLVDKIIFTQATK